MSTASIPPSGVFGAESGSFGATVQKDNVEVLSHAEFEQQLNGVRRGQGTSGFGSKLNQTISAFAATIHGQDTPMFGQTVPEDTSFSKTWVRKLLTSTVPPKVFTSDTSDLGASIVITSRSTLDLRSAIGSIQTNVQEDITGSVTGVLSNRADLRSILTPLTSSSTQPGTSITKIVGTLGGYSTITLSFNARPDLTATIAGMFSFDLSASIQGRALFSNDLRAIISGFARNVTTDLGGSLSPFTLSDIGATLLVVPPKDLGGYLQTIPYTSLSAVLQTIPGADLEVSIGGHLPFDIAGNIFGFYPEDMRATIRAALAGTNDLGASISQIGGFKQITAMVRTAERSSSDLQASVLIRFNPELLAEIKGFVASDLHASIITQRVGNLRSIIKGWARVNSKNLSASLRRQDTGVVTLGVTPFKARVSAHTADKIPNLDKVIKAFPNNIYLLGSRQAGLNILTLEPVFGNFPDMHAQITVTQFFKSHLSGYVNTAQVGKFDLGGPLTAVTPHINITKLNLNLTPALSMYGSLDINSTFGSIRAIVTPTSKQSTDTPIDAGFVTTANSFRFYIASSAGVFIPGDVPATIRISTFTNNSLLPDLHAYLAGWHVSDLSASISNFPFRHLSASVTALDTSHLSDLGGGLFPNHLVDIQASIVPAGGFNSFAATITVSGAVSSMNASIFAALASEGTNTITVHTKPFVDMTAMINYNSSARCFPQSQVSSLSAYVRPFLGGGTSYESLTATLNALSGTYDMGASVTGRTVSKITLIDFILKTANRSSTKLATSIVPLVKVVSDVAASIVGLSHEQDLTADITVVRLPPQDITAATSETVVNLDGSSQEKEILLTFKSQVTSYIYDSLTSGIFSLDGDKWQINLQSRRLSTGIEDLAEGTRDIGVTSLQGFYSLDEAIRSAIVVLCERHQSELSASITSSGSVAKLSAQIGVQTRDKLSDLTASAFLVTKPPQLTAAINTGNFASALRLLDATIVPTYSEIKKDITASVSGKIISNLAASVTAV